MKKIFTYLLIVVTCVAMSGCNSYLDIEKHGNLGSIDDFYQTDEEAEEAIATVYNSINNIYYTWYMTKNLLSDDAWCGGGSRGDNADLEKINEYNFDSDHGYINGMYSGLYTVIYYANLVLDRVSTDTSVKQRVYAEAKYFRAWAHFELVTMWGTAPIVDHVLEPSEYRQGNSDPADTWAFIESDLEDAINSGWLPSKTSVDDEATTIRITKETAEAMLGKAYVFEEKWSEAATMLDKVIDSGLYALWTGDYDLILHSASNNCCEKMFELQKREDTDQEWYFAGLTWLMCGWRTENFTFSGQAYDEIAQGTWGFCCPQKSLYDAFVANGEEGGYRQKATIRTVDELEDYGLVLTAGKYLMGCEGYLYWKMRCLKADLTQDNMYYQALYYTNWPMMRYAEVLLLAAEAQFEAGNVAKATEYVNQIRTRAQLPSLSTVTLDNIKTEKRLELCMETLRYQDLVRWGDAETVLAEQGKEIPIYYTTGAQYPYSNTIYGFKSKHKLLPIPEQEMELNANMTQNEGW